MNIESLAAHARMAELVVKLEQQAIDQRMRVVTEITTELERSQAGRREDNEHFQKCLSRLQKETAEREEALRKQMKYVEEIAKYKDRHIEHRKFQMVATSHEFQQRIKVLVNEGMKGKEVEMRSKFTKERDERIELVVEMLQSEKEKIIGQHKNELKAKVEAVIADKLEIEKDLKDNKSKFSELSNTLLLRKVEAKMGLEEAGKKMASLRTEMQTQTRLIMDLQNQHDAQLRNQEETFEARLEEEQRRLQQTKTE